MKLRDALWLLLLTAIIPVAGLQLTWRWREQSNRIRCADNLRSIGIALQMYANENKDRFPRTTFVDAANPFPTAYTGVAAGDPFGLGGPAANDVTAGPFLLLRSGALTADAFVCPSDANATPWDFAGNSPTNCSNFPSRAHLSYGYGNPYIKPVKRWTSCVWITDTAIAADMGPRAPSGGTVPVMTNAERTASNSPNHRGAGQNVLFSDIHLEWSPTVFAGGSWAPGGVRDHIYAYGPDAPGQRNANSYGSPQDIRDGVVLPLSDYTPPAPASPDPAGR